MAVSNIKAAFSCDIKTVWDLVTSLENYSWRSDLDKITVLNETQFIEHTKEGFETTFTITCREECKRWELDMENQNMKGHWTGVFSSGGDGTMIDFTEDVTAKKVWMKPFVGMYLRKQQSQYLADLKRCIFNNIQEDERNHGK